MATYESQANTGITTVSNASPNLVVNKPSGLAVGDYMFAFICGFHTGSFSVSYATPSGWTLLESTTNTSVNWRMYCFYKIADSSDVAASNFTWVATTAGTNPAVGLIARVSDVTGIDDSNNSNSLTITNALTSIDAPNDVMLMCVADRATSVSGYAFATDDPTWTEQVDTTDSTDVLGFATATRAETTNSGNATATAGSNGCMVVVAISESVSGSLSATALEINSVVPPFPVDAIEITSQVPTPTTSTKNTTSWSLETRPATTWTLENKP